MKKSVIVLSLLILSISTSAQKPSNFFTKTLGNGLEVLVVEDNSVPLATIEITTKNGSYTEPPEFNGLSHLYEHMFFKANKDYPSQEKYMAKVRELGIAFNGTTSEESVNYFFTLPKTNLDKGLSFMNAAIRYPLFLTEEMEKENVVVDGEFQRHESNPYFPLQDAMKHSLYGDLYSRKNEIGNHEIINTATPQKMQAIKEKYYWPNNSMLLISGDVKHEEVFNKVESIFSDWKSSGFDPFTKWPIPEIKPLSKTDYFITESPDVKVPMMIFNWLGPDTRNDKAATYAADVFSYIVSHGSKFQQKMYENDLILQADVSYLTQKYTGPIDLTVVPNPDKVAACLVEIKKQISMWDEDFYITDEQIENAKRQIAIQTERKDDITSDLSHTIAFWWCSADLDYMYNYIKNINKVTKADIQGYVRKYIKGKNYSAGLLISPSQKAKLNPASFWKQ